MALVYPVELAAKSTTIAVSRGLFWFGAVFIAADVTAITFIGIDRATLIAVPAALAMLAILGAGIVVRSRLGARRKWRIIAALTAVVSMTVIAGTLVPRVDPSQPSDTIVLSLVKVSVIVFAVVAGQYVNSVLACVAGLAIAELPVTAVSVASGHPFTLDVATAASFGIAVLAVGLLDFSRARTRSMSTRLTAASDEDRRAVELALWARSSSALVHDTVLNELAVISAVAPGELSGPARDRIRRSLALVGGPVIIETEPSGVPAASPLAAVLGTAADAGLDITLNGAVDAVETLSPDVASALVLAVSQCLENVLQHSGVRSAELTVLQTGSEVCVLVIDAGVGFDEKAVGGDRLGLRNSVRRRIVDVGGRVDVWAAVGAGTSISILVPRS
jgi:hypothetical protein